MPRRLKNIYKRKDGRWEARYIGGYDTNGKAKYISVYAHSYSEVKQKLINAPSKKKIRTDTLQAPTVSAWFADRMQKLKPEIKPSTYAVYRRYLDKHINPCLGHLKITELSEEIIQDFIDGCGCGCLSVSSIKNIFMFLKAGLADASEKKLIEDICRSARLPREKDKTPMRVFSRSEQTSIEYAALNSCNPNDIGVIICLYTGLRVGELCGLMWEDINFQSAVMSVRRTVQRISTDENGKKTSVVVLPPKSMSSARDIPIPKLLLDKLLSHQKLYGTCQYILHNNGCMTEPRYCQYNFSRLLKSANIKSAKFHTTRHTFAARALESGMDIKTLSEILGHADAVITMKRYAHSSDIQKRICIEKLAESAFNGDGYGQISG